MKALVKRSLTLMAVLSIVALSACSGGGAVPPSTVATSDAPASGAATVELSADNVNAWLDEYMPKELDSRKIAGATVAVVKDGEMLTTRGFGHADLGTKGNDPVPVDPDKHIFRVASIAKIPTSIAVMQLVEQGKVDLDTDINSYVDVPIKRRFDTPITLRHLLTHTAGFEEHLGLGIGAESFDLETGAMHEPPEQVYEPGTTYGYSNYGMSLAGFIVQKVSGQRFEDYTREHIFEPLGMDSTTYEQPLPEALRPRMSQGYPDSTQAPSLFRVTGQPSGSLTSSAPDFAKFMIAQMNHDPRILKPETWEQMQTADPNEKLGGMQKGDRIGLGYFLTQHNGHKVIGHSGDFSHFHSLYQIYPEHGVGVFVSFNSTGILPGPAYADFGARFADQFFPDITPESSLTPEERIQHANQVAGTYKSSRQMESTFLAQFEFEHRVDVTNNGIFLASRNKEYIEIEPFVWREIDGDTRISADFSTGKPRLNVGSTRVLDLLPPDRALMGLSRPLGIVLLGSVLLLWFIGGVRVLDAHHRGDKPNTLGKPGRLARLGGILALVMPVVWVVTAVVITRTVEQHIPEWWIRGVQGLQLLAVLALIPAVWDVVRAVRDKRGWPRVLVSVALVVGLLAMACWAILGNALSLDISY
ncbi:MAG: serine hydrolase domain-containing protein [Actinomycetaceae bacterium]|nr:serine hydrolase domain-containing protein [Actinomycetaceae bacterium]